jgi:hypothetical protein
MCIEDVGGAQGMTLDQVKDLCVGPEGSQVTMNIRSTGQPDATISMVILRAECICM